VGTARLAGYRLAFTGYSAGWDGAVATLVPDLTACVDGRLFAMGAEDFVALDRCEGHPDWYRRGALRVRDGRGRYQRAETYVAPVEEGGEAAPSLAYLGQIWRAYRALDFDVLPLLQAATVRGTGSRSGGTETTMRVPRRALTG
jgi:hypothetical protein